MNTVKVKENENISTEPVLSFEEYVTLECERQWNENQKETYGEWAAQSEDTKVEYYNDMFVNLMGGLSD